MQLEHWMPPAGGVRMCRMHRRRVADGSIIFTGRNGGAVWTLTPITNVDGINGAPGYMLLLNESTYHQTGEYQVKPGSGDAA